MNKLVAFRYDDVDISVSSKIITHIKKLNVKINDTINNITDTFNSLEEFQFIIDYYTFWLDRIAGEKKREDYINIKLSLVSASHPEFYLTNKFDLELICGFIGDGRPVKKMKKLTTLIKKTDELELKILSNKLLVYLSCLASGYVKDKEFGLVGLEAGSVGSETGSDDSERKE